MEVDIKVKNNEIEISPVLSWPNDFKIFISRKISDYHENILNNPKAFIICIANQMIILPLVAFIIASYGLSILYLFLLADLFCCAAVITVFFTFFKKGISEKNAYISIIIGLFIGLLLFLEFVRRFMFFFTINLHFSKKNQ